MGRLIRVAQIAGCGARCQVDRHRLLTEKYSNCLHTRQPLLINNLKRKPGSQNFAIVPVKVMLCFDSMMRHFLPSAINFMETFCNCTVSYRSTR